VRKLLQLKLRTLFALMCAACLILGLWAARAKRRADAVAWVERQGGAVWYTHQVSPDGRFRITHDIAQRSHISGTLEAHTVLLGRVDDLDPVCELSELKRIEIGVDPHLDSDLERYLMGTFNSGRLPSTPVPKRSPTLALPRLAQLARLESLKLDYLTIGDLAPLASLRSLKELSLDGTLVSDLAPLRDLTQLKILSLDQTNVMDLSPLYGLKRLRLLNVNATYVSLEQIQAIQLRLPACEIAGRSARPYGAVGFGD